MAAEAVVWLDIAKVPRAQSTPLGFVEYPTSRLAELFAWHEVPTAYMVLSLFADRYREWLGKRKLYISEIAQYIIMLADTDALWVMCRLEQRLLDIEEKPPKDLAEWLYIQL